MIDLSIMQMMTAQKENELCEPRQQERGVPRILRGTLTAGLQRVCRNSTNDRQKNDWR